MRVLLEAAIGIEPMNKGFAESEIDFVRVCWGAFEYIFIILPPRFGSSEFSESRMSFSEFAHISHTFPSIRAESSLLIGQDHGFYSTADVASKFE